MIPKLSSLLPPPSLPGVCCLIINLFCGTLETTHVITYDTSTSDEHRFMMIVDKNPEDELIQLNSLLNKDL